MAEEVIYCPQCNQKVRVPEEMLGQVVQCPLCNLVYTAPLRGGPPMVLPVAPGQYPAAGPYATGAPANWGVDPREAARQAVRAPAIALLVTGIIGLAFNLIGLGTVIYVLAAGPDAMLDQMERVFPPGQLQDAMKETWSPEGLRQNLVMTVLFLGVCVVICIAAVQMLRLRVYWLALAGCVLAMVNIENCCCMLGLPIGIWALVMLLQPGVRNSFE